MLVKFELEELLKQHPQHGCIYENTSEYWEGSVTGQYTAEVCSRIAASPELLNTDRVCVIYGYGSQSTSTYRDLAKDRNLRILWEDNFGPWWMGPLLWVAASRGGFIQVLDSESVCSSFTKLTNSAMVEIYSFSSEFLDEVKRYVAANRWKSLIGTVIGRDESYFCYGVNGDDEGGPQGWVSFGATCPENLKRVPLKVAELLNPGLRV